MDDGKAEKVVSGKDPLCPIAGGTQEEREVDLLEPVRFDVELEVGKTHVVFHHDVAGADLVGTVLTLSSDDPSSERRRTQLRGNGASRD